MRLQQRNSYHWSCRLVFGKPNALLLSALLVAAVLAPGRAFPAAADEIDNETCLSCHGTEGFAGPNQQPLYVAPEAFAGSVHESLTCQTCHADATSVPHEATPAKVKLDACAMCHGDQVDAYKKGIHGRANGDGVVEAPTCTNCHGSIHSILPHTNDKSAAHWSNLAKTCAHCHANVELAQKFHIPVVRPVEAYLQGVHARAVAEGRRAAVCSDCHRSHDILPASSPESSIYRDNVPKTCGNCHKAILVKYGESVHGQALKHGVRDAPVCTTCHGEHEILAPTSPESPVFAANLTKQTCGRCHGDLRLDRKYGLSAGKVAAFEDSFHGLALSAGRVSVANCASCHGVHDILPSSNPKSSINPANLPKTCGKCHPGAGTRFAIGSVHGGPSALSTILQYWIGTIYFWLIVLVIGFMAFHNGLDLSHKVNGTEHHSSMKPLTNPPQRMSRALRWQHGLVMLSFPMLVYTGFALKYPSSWWAEPLMHWEPHVALRGILHRIFAVMLMATLVWHVVHLAVSRRLRACLLWGMMWRLSDLKQFFGIMAYYLRLRPDRPPVGDLTYIEKAEYWAFLWGMLVMSVTGLILWFVNRTLQYLPGWTPDVATAIHFWEAILATLAILVWHFYWVIFDPEVYPMDWTWWTGYSPPSRVAERMGEELQAAKEEEERGEEQP